uniref:Cytochrome P450 n=1 Tax=Malurus cyaneus samueli TaxID=2593467 RepID=A0A8C5T4G4_9PASS
MRGFWDKIEEILGKNGKIVGKELGLWESFFFGFWVSLTPLTTPQLSDQYGPVFTVWLGPRPVLVLRGTEAVREALVGQAEAFAGRGRMPTLESTFRGYGVVFSDGERWRQLRRFSLTVLRDFGMGKRSIESRIQEEAQELLQEFQKTQAFDPTFLLSCAVSNIICSIVFGSRFDYQDPEFLERMQLINNSFQEMSTPWSQVGLFGNFLGIFLILFLILEFLEFFGIFLGIFRNFLGILGIFF